MLYPLILVVHIFVCFVLVAVILLQAGRGGGLAEAFGGTAQSIFGTRGAVYLTRATTVCAVVFMLTSLGLAFLSARRGRSLMEGVRPATEPGHPPAGGWATEVPGARQGERPPLQAPLEPVAGPEEQAAPAEEAAQPEAPAGQAPEPAKSE